MKKEYYYENDFERTLKANKGLIKNICKEFKSLINASLAMEDMESICSYALYKAFINYDSNETKWITFSSIILRNELRMLYKKMNTKKRIVNKYTCYFENSTDSSDEDTSYKNFISGLKYETFENKFILKETMLEILNNQEQEVFYLFIEDMKQTDIAKILNMSQPQVSKLVRRIKSKLKENL